MFVLVFPPDVSRKVSGEVTKPNYGCQVTIHSEQEKQMMKMYRREEKRERKRGKGTDDSDCSDAVMPFDPREMRAQRYIIFSNFLLVVFSSFVFVLCLSVSSCGLKCPTPKLTSCFIFHDNLALRNKKKGTAMLQLVTFFSRGFFWKFNFRGWKKEQRSV